MPDYIPTKDSDLKGYASNMSQRIAADPSLYHLTTEQADLLLERTEAFAVALQRSFDMITRGPSSTFRKNEARVELVKLIREYVAKIRADRSIPDPLKIELGIPLRKETLTRIGKPKERPIIHARPKTSHSIEMEIIDFANGRASKPENVAAAAVYVYLGEQGPVDAAQWVYYGNYTKTRIVLPIKGKLDYGQQVWITAAWVNPRGERGPTAFLKNVRITGGPNIAAIPQGLAA